MAFPAMVRANSTPGRGSMMASVPIQLVSPASVTICAKTASIGAAISIACRNSAIGGPHRGFHRAFEGFQRTRPEIAEIGLDDGEPVLIHREDVPGAIAPLGDQPRRVQRA